MATSPQTLLFSKTTTKNNQSQHFSRTSLLDLLNEPTTMPRLKQIHAHTLRTIDTTHPQALFFFSRILLHYSSLADLSKGTRVFHHFPKPNSFMWNTLIRAYAGSTNHKREAMKLYKAMMTMDEEKPKVLPDNHTFPFVLKACAYTFSLCEGKQVHAHVLKRGFESDTHVCNSLIHFYSTCGCLDLAEKIFQKMDERNEVSWNIIIDSYAKGGNFDTALRMFGEMLKVYDPDGYTLQSVISACAGLGALSLGLWVHVYILKKCDKSMVSDVLVNTSLVNMYCKCGSLEIAKQVFESMPSTDVNSWNSMILGFAMHGEAEAALEYYARMVTVKKVIPNSITFVGVLSACNHRGMVGEGIVHFNMMTKYNVEPRLEHYGCLVDLLARAGRIDDALNLVSDMPIKPDAIIWRSLLDACCKQHASVELSEEMAKQVFESDGSVCSGTYLLLSKVYASASRWNDVGLLRKLMSDEGVTKDPGCSLIEIDGVVHQFFARDTNHSQSEIEEKLESMGYLPNYSGAPMVDEVNNGKQDAL
ncbi:hypothetical protein Fmac_018542 [Flemingia macrophylla]|uniref:Pentatricopeptide repeat-containing protein n=1 Tax=Flemingia macrophylla TaxID=520843 RepID=A0ABD1M5E2_9FABA